MIGVVVSEVTTDSQLKQLDWVNKLPSFTHELHAYTKRWAMSSVFLSKQTECRWIFQINCEPLHQKKKSKPKPVHVFAFVVFCLAVCNTTEAAGRRVNSSPATQSSKHCGCQALLWPRTMSSRTFTRETAHNHQYIWNCSGLLALPRKG